MRRLIVVGAMLVVSRLDVLPATSRSEFTNVRELTGITFRHAASRTISKDSAG
jgi:hypothetical protein